MISDSERSGDTQTTVYCGGNPIPKIQPRLEGESVWPNPVIEGQTGRFWLRQLLHSETYFEADVLAICINGRLRWAVRSRHRRPENRIDKLFASHKTLS